MESEYIKNLSQIEEDIKKIKKAKITCMETLKNKLKNSQENLANCMKLMELYNKKTQPYVQKTKNNKRKSIRNNN